MDPGLMFADDTQSLNLLLDEREIIGRINAYCTTLDGRDFEGLRHIYTPDATALLGSTECGDLAAIIEKCRGSLSRLDGSHHLVGNYQIVVEGDTATSLTYLQAQHINNRVEGDSLYVMAGHYTDAWVHTSIGWRISRRVLTITWTSGNRQVLGR